MNRYSVERKGSSSETTAHRRKDQAVAQALQHCEKATNNEAIIKSKISQRVLVKYWRDANGLHEEEVPVPPGRF